MVYIQSRDGARLRHTHRSGAGEPVTSSARLSPSRSFHNIFAGRSTKNLAILTRGGSVCATVTRMLVSLAVPATHDRGPLHMEQVLRTLHPVQSGRSWLRLRIGVRDGQSTLFAGADGSLSGTLRDQLAAHYPECHLERLEREDIAPRAGYGAWHATLTALVPPIPIRTYHSFQDPSDHHLADPLTTFLGVIAQEREPLVQARIELLARPATRRERARVRTVTKRIAHHRLQRHPRLRSLYARNACAASVGRRLFARALFAIVSLNARPLRSQAEVHRNKTPHAKSGQPLFAVQIHLVASAPLLAVSRAQHKLTELAGAFAQFSVDDVSAFRLGRVRTVRPWRRRATSLAFLTAEELATLWHPPTAEVHTSRREHVESRELEPPARLASTGPDRSLAVLGRLKFRSRHDIVGLSSQDRLRHLYIVGKTGPRQVDASSESLGRGYAGGTRRGFDRRAWRPGRRRTRSRTEAPQQ